MNKALFPIISVSLLLYGRTSSLLAAAPGSDNLPAASKQHWTADNGNGTYSNPLFYEEFEDPDVIRVGTDYYLAGTTMHMNPALIIMHSKDLVNWELASYCTNKLDFGPAYRLEGGNIYGRGIWAPCIRYHDGTFYVFSNVNGAALQVFRSKSITGPWEHSVLPGRHDLSVLFDDDGKIYLISGNSNPYPIDEIAPDLGSFVPGVRHQLSVPQGQRMGEGHHLYKINGKYYDVSAIPGGPVNQVVAKADLGRVALKASNGRFVSASEDGVSLKDLAGRKPGDAGSFQWINLMRGDTAFMSLVNHRYLTTKPNEPGPATIAATSPTPSRKGGECFKWKAVE